jgi:hypothetical protein
MAGGYMNELHMLYFAGHHGALMNNNGGFYQRGKSYGLEVKLLVAAKYLDHKERLGGLRPLVTQVVAECCVGKDFVCKIEREIMRTTGSSHPMKSILLMISQSGQDQRQ